MSDSRRRCAACCVLLWATTVAAQDGNTVVSAWPQGANLRLPSGDSVPPYVSVPAATGDELSQWHSTPRWNVQVLPQELIYQSYLAGGKEPRLASQWVYERDQGWLWDLSVGGRVGLVRAESTESLWPEAVQLDLEGAAFPRLTLDTERDLVSVDFRGGVPLSYRFGPWEAKFAYYHLSSHLGDEFMLKNPTISRINYSRDALVFGTAWRPRDDIRLYAEAGWAFYADEGSEPWEFQFGVDWSRSRDIGLRGAPFFAANVRLREEVDYGGNATLQAGWQWCNVTGQRIRAGLYYFNGKSDQYEFVQEHEELIGSGFWYDF